MWELQTTALDYCNYRDYGGPTLNAILSCFNNNAYGKVKVIDLYPSQFSY